MLTIKKLENPELRWLKNSTFYATLDKDDNSKMDIIFCSCYEENINKLLLVANFWDVYKLPDEIYENLIEDFYDTDAILDSNNQFIIEILKNKNYFEIACKYDSLDFLLYLLSKKWKTNSDDIYTCVKFGSLSCFKHLSLYNYDFFKENGNLIYIKAIENDHLNILKFFDSHPDISIIKTKLHFEKALMTEKIEILNYLNSFYENGIFYFFTKEELELLYTAAIENENLNVLKNTDLIINIVKTKLHFEKALVIGNLEILKFIDLCYQINFDSNFKINLDMLKYLVNYSYKTRRLKLEINHIIYFFLKNDLDSLNYIYSISQSYSYFKGINIIKNDCIYKEYMIEIIPIEYRNKYIDEKLLIKEYLKDNNYYNNYSWLIYYLINCLEINNYLLVHGK